MAVGKTLRRTVLTTCVAGAVAAGNAHASWESRQAVDPFDDEVRTSAVLPGSDGYVVGLRCDAPTDGSTQLMLVFGHDEPLAEPSETVTVKLRVDRLATRVLESRLFIDSDRAGYTTIARGGEALDLDYLALVDELRRGDAGVVGFEVYGKRPWHPFTLAGAAKAMDPVLAACGIPDPTEPIRRAARMAIERAERVAAAREAATIVAQAERIAAEQALAAAIAEREAQRRAAAVAKAARIARERAQADAIAAGERGRLELEASAAIVAAEAEIARRAADADRREERAAERAAKERAAEEKPSAARAADETRRLVERRALEERAEQKRAELERMKRRYLMSIRARLQRSLRRPPGHDGPIDCLVHMTQSRAGAVLRVSVTDCAGGDRSIARALEDAARRASPLPAAPDQRVFDRRIALRWSS